MPTRSARPRASSCAPSPSSPRTRRFLEMLAPSFEGLAEDLTEENLQPRIRGVLLMALSNKFRGWLVLTTGNKSELAVGYSTLYGDTAGGLRGHQGRAQAAGLRPVPPLQRAGRPGRHPRGRAHQAAVGRAAARASATTSRCRPTRCSTRSSRPTSSTTSPAASSIEDGFDPALVDRITRLVDISEYKRRQNPPGPAHHTEGVRQGSPHADHQRATADDRRSTRSPPSSSTSRGCSCRRHGRRMTEAGGGNLELLIGSYEEDGDHPWHQVERGEIGIGEWVTEVTRRGNEIGIEVDFSPLQAMLGELTVHTQVVDRVRSLRAAGYRLGLITNNVREASGSWRALVPVDELFEVIVDSSEVGMRKPNPAIFLHALELLGGVAPAAAVFLDDSPGNVVGARRPGSTPSTSRRPTRRSPSWMPCSPRDSDRHPARLLRRPARHRRRGGVVRGVARRQRHRPAAAHRPHRRRLLPARRVRARPLRPRAIRHRHRLRAGGRAVRHALVASVLRRAQPRRGAGVT